MTPIPGSVLVVGAGPAGLATAVELARRDIPVRIVESRAAWREGTRACGMWQRTLELLDRMGAATDELIERSAPYSHMRLHFHGVDTGAVDMTEEASARRRPIQVGQSVTEEVMARRLADLGVQLEREATAHYVGQDGERVTVELHHADGSRSTVRASYLVVAQGSNSGIRTALGIGRSGEQLRGVQSMQIDGQVSWDADLDMEEAQLFAGPHGYLGYLKLPGVARLFMGTDDPDPGNWDPPTVPEIESAARRITGHSVRITDAAFGWRVRFQNFLADSYRRGRVFLVGDSAHVWPPFGAQGMSAGIHDGVNLAWKLAEALREGHVGLLDSYEAERRPAAERQLGATRRMRQLATAGANPLLQAALPAAASSVVPLPEVQRFVRRLHSGLDVGYPHSRPLSSGEDSATAAPGSRAPLRAGEWDLAGALHPTGWTLVAFPGTYPTAELATLAERFPRLRHVRVHRQRPSTQPAGHVDHHVHDLDRSIATAYGVDEPTLFLIRPDGHIGLRTTSVTSAAVSRYLHTVATSPPNRV